MDALRRAVEERKRKSAALANPIPKSAKIVTQASSQTQRPTTLPGDQKRPMKNENSEEDDDDDSDSKEDEVSQAKITTNSSNNPQANKQISQSSSSSSSSQLPPHSSSSISQPKEKQSRTEELMEIVFSDPVSAPGSTAEDRVRGWIQEWMSAWRAELLSMEEAERRSAKGRLAVRTFEDALGDVAPLVALLKCNQVNSEVLTKLDSIVAHCQSLDYVSAGETYISLTIGNAAWPIGVTQVGIHMRAGRVKIEESKVQHIMKDETARRYLTTFKRLMTRAQEARPSKPSLMLG